MGVHRVAKGFVIQTGYLPSRSQPLSEPQQRLVRNLQPEFNDTPHVKGTVSMARGDDPASADTSFFIVLGPSPVLDGKYTAFGPRCRRTAGRRGHRAGACERRGASDSHRDQERARGKTVARLQRKDASYRRFRLAASRPNGARHTASNTRKRLLRPTSCIGAVLSRRAPEARNRRIRNGSDAAHREMRGFS
jgi:cyclophilin family peptidyl-prolyl cis-trans isomerase